ncbi:glycosyltransferase [Desulfobacter postgatei]|uniref:Glycosyltransferase n=1 Tax=Desulfobacter postgatei 2ac9 TaxID=879212 RepID=I5B5W2_9BACT|nr:glycosyltransferase [Desulfobacter postgatei]EIM64875.1 glycosyltransferase [Desulfobacter postgatei 2ac9]
MRVLIINTFSCGGGAARAARRLHHALLDQNIDSFFLSSDGIGTERDYLAQITDYKSAEIDGDIQGNYINKNRTSLSNTFFSVSLAHYDIMNLVLEIKPDIINLHWVARFLSYEILERLLSLHIPIVWTLHDERPYTGGCHYTAGCDQFISQKCANCPQLKQDPLSLTKKNLEKSNNLLKGKKVTVVCPSSWLSRRAKQSAVFCDNQILTIKNCVEIDIFTQLDKRKEKERLGIPVDSIAILAGAHDNKEKRKGYSYFLHALKIINDDYSLSTFVKQGKIVILIVGEHAEDIEFLGYKTKNFGYINDDSMLSSIYNAADVFVLPSLEDNLPNTLLESGACATPMVAFNSGGISDIVIDRKTGLLAKTGSAIQLALHLKLLINYPDTRNRLGENARAFVTKECNPNKQAEEYLNVYQSLT